MTACSLTCRHELIGKVVMLGMSFHPNATTQELPKLYAMLKISDKVISPFTVLCGECQYVLLLHKNISTH